MSIESKTFFRASIDVGTNSCRLLIAEILKKENNLSIKKIWYRDLEIIKLGEEVNKNKFLKEEAIERTIKVLKKYKNIIDTFKIKKEDIVCFATSATRDSLNRDYFIKKVKDEAGIEIKCISGEKEAYINFKGVMSAFSNVERNILVFDIGGGSTEFILGNINGIEQIKSLNIGSVRISEKFFLNGNKYDYCEENIKKAEIWVKENLEALCDYKESIKREQLSFSRPLNRGVSELTTLEQKNILLIGVAGTVTTQISVRDKMEVYDSDKIHMSKLTKNEILKNLDLYIENISLEKKVKGLDLKRRDVIIGGTIILKNILNYFDINKIIVSEADNLTGAILGGLDD